MNCCSCGSEIERDEGQFFGEDIVCFECLDNEKEGDID